MNYETHATEDVATKASLGDLIAKPVWSFTDLTQIFGLPVSTLEQVLREHPAPFFLLGRRRFIKRGDAMEWLDDVAAANRHYPRKNNRRCGGCLMNTNNLEYQLLRSARYAPTSTAGVVADKYLKEENLVDAIQKRLAAPTTGYGFWPSAEARILAHFMVNAGLSELLPTQFAWVAQGHRA